MDTGNDCRADDQSLEAIKLLWMFINKHASDLNEGTNIFNIDRICVPLCFTGQFIFTLI